jgi:hypothetical protein
MNHSGNRQIYNEAVGGMSLSKRMKTAWVVNIFLQTNICYIAELLLEQEVNKRGNDALYIPPIVLAEMLLMLSHCRLGSRSQYLQSLTDLQNLLLYDDGRYVPISYRDVSWQILGICQHVVGDLNGALHSYHESLRQEQFNNIQAATENRIMFVVRQLQGSIPSPPPMLVENLLVPVMAGSETDT